MRRKGKLDVQMINLYQLCDAITTIWNKISVESMLLWSQPALKAQGGATHYKQSVPNTVASESILFIY